MPNLTVNNKDNTIAFNNADLGRGGWSNFSGRPLPWDPANTKRTFTIFLTEEEYKRLKDLGWNVKEREPKNASEPSTYHLKVTVNYDVSRKLQPRIWLVRNSGDPVLLEPEDLFQLDDEDTIITRAKVQIRAYDWEWGTGKNARKGRKAMLKQMFITIEQEHDDFGAEFFNRDEEEMPFEE